MYSMNSKSFAGSILVAACLLFGGNAMAADATPDQVYQAAQAGHYREAQTMMDQILRDHPNSAKAHFVEAELLGKQGKLPQAQEELNTALRLDPSQNFARPGAVDELRTLIASGNASHAAGKGTFGGNPWGLVLGIVAVLIIVSMVMRARRRAAYSQGPNGPYGYGAGRGPAPYGGPPAGPQGGYGYPGGAAPGQAAGGMGSSIMGGLATGAAVGAGVVAGEALMNRVLHGGSGSANTGNAGNVVDTGAVPDVGSANSQEAGYDMGGTDFGLRDASSWDGDDTRKVASNDGGDNSWNVGNPWDDDGSSSDSGGSWDDGGGGGSDDWT